MKKAVLISIRPNWCDLIVRRKKTIEVRKTRPKLETPFKVYIYCTKAPQHLITIFKDGEEIEDGEIHHGKPVFLKCDKYLPDSICGKTQMVIGEFICDCIEQFDSDFSEYASTCASENCIVPMSEGKALKICHEQGCLSNKDLLSYFGDEGWKAYFWHISDLKIYDKPRDLDEFSRFGFFGMGRSDCVCGNWRCENYEPSESYMIPPTCKIDGCSICRPPQSWLYISEENM